MTARDARGRFVSDREHAATLLLEAAVREARRLTAYQAPIERWPGHVGHIWTTHDFRPAVVTLLAEATRSADLLLRSAS